MNIKIGLKGLLIPVDEIKLLIPDTEMTKILKTLTIKGKIVGRKTSQFTAPIIKHAYKTEKINNIKYLILPKIAISKFTKYNPIIDITISNIKIRKFEYKNANVELYPYQKTAIDYLFNISNQDNLKHSNVA